MSAIKGNVSWKTIVSITALTLLPPLTDAYADGSFLLQLGTFETREDAAKKWDDVKAANPDVVGTLKGHVAEVMLPPDNIASYRTQVGPVESRKSAKALCSALNAKNVDCFVVETAFAAADLSPEMIGEAAPVPVTQDVAAVPATAVAPAAPIRAAAPEDQISASDDLPPVTADSPLALAPAPAPAAPIAVAPRETMAAVPASASPVTEAVPEPVAQEEKKEVEDKPGFFGRMFTKSPTPVNMSPATPEPQKNVVQASRTEYSNPNDVKKSGFFRGTFRLSEDKKTENETPAPVVTAKKEDDKPGFFGRLFSSDEEQKTEAATAAPTRQQGAVVDEAAAANIKGDVEVAEAIRVPVTSEGEAQQAQYQPVLVKQDSVAAAEAESTTTVSGAGNFFVQVSYFENEAGAFKFYDGMKKANPGTFDAVRFRITRPFAVANRDRASLRMGPITSADTVNLACANAKQNNLRCTTIRDAISVDSTVAPVTKRVAKRYPSPLEAVSIPGYNAEAVSATAAVTTTDVQSPLAITTPVVSGTVAEASRVSETGVGIGGQWVYLGDFETAQSAWNHWKVMQSNVAELANARSSITGTIGKEKKLYMLRAGPMNTDIEAEKVCKAIVKTGNKCSAVEAP